MLFKASGFQDERKSVRKKKKKKEKKNQCGREGKKYLKSFRTMCIISWVPSCKI